MDLYQDLTEAERVAHIQDAAEKLVAEAKMLGVNLRVGRTIDPVTGRVEARTVEAWASRWFEADRAYNDYYHKISASMSLAAWRSLWLTGDTPRQKWLAKQQAAPARSEISDREWAAQPANMREGCTVRIPGVGEL